MHGGYKRSEARFEEEGELKDEFKKGNEEINEEGQQSLMSKASI